MTNETFCRLYSQFYGEEISSIEQLKYSAFTGEELKEFADFIEKSTDQETDGLKSKYKRKSSREI